MAPVVDELKKKYEGKVVITQIDTDQDGSKTLMEQHDIKAMPTFVFIDAQGKVIKKQEGALSKDMLEKWIKYLLANSKECPT